MSRTILLTQGKFAIVDDEDFDWLNQWKWFCHRGYAMRKVGWPQREVYMHREIVQAPDGVEVDHINMERADNRRENLRICTRSGNMANRRVFTNNTSGYKGVSFDKGAKKKQWRARLSAGGTSIDLGRFSTPEKAARAYDHVATLLHGDFARRNFPDD